MEYQVDGADLVIVSILVLGIGHILTERIPVLKAVNIPVPVTGGILCSVLVVLLDEIASLSVTFDMRTRDVLLLVFFSTIGLSAKIRQLLAGGRALLTLLILAVIFLVIQNLTGVVLAFLFRANTGYGLFAGSISFAGGHGTAIAWGQVAEEGGLQNAAEIGIAFATFGLIAGGVIGGPIAGRLISRLPAESRDAEDRHLEAGTDSDEKRRQPVRLPEILVPVLMLAVCVSVGDLVNRFLVTRGVLLPGFLTAMVVGILLTNIRDVLKRPIDSDIVDTISDVALNLFLAMSLMSMDLGSIASSAGPVLVAVVVQMIVIAVFAVAVVFRVMGRDYDAAVISGGFLGLGLGATPVAIANMHAVTARYRPSPKAMLVVPLVGAFFIDIVNSIVIKLFLASPFIWIGDIS